MGRLGIVICLVALAAFPALPAAAQSQSCPVNINFSDGTLIHWQAYTGNNKGGNGPDAIKMIYDSGQSAPNGTINATALPEYELGVSGIRVITGQGTDPFGNFPTIPTINGYAYNYSILLGSTSVSNRPVSDDPNGSPNAPPANGPQGGYVRGISYLINVPPGPPTLPYTMTYAYAMVLENGTHTSLDQPMARAIVSTSAGVITCASPEYYLPTNGGLDSATARANGFSPSPVPTPNMSRNQQNPGQYLQDVWTKGWTEVTFDLSPYRGQQVSLTFEADNCVPGGHFAYAYFALRDVCAGLRISGDTLACSNSVAKYAIPALDNATYDWSVPPGWSINPNANNSNPPGNPANPGNPNTPGNTITVTVGPQPGWIVARETNSCTSLVDSIFVHLYKGALPQFATDPRDTTICYGSTTPVHAFITTGTEYSWTSAGSFTGTKAGDIPSVPFTTSILAAPEKTTDYILKVKNDGCPIIVSDTMTINIVPPIHVNLGHDTLVVVGQPLQFHATSTDLYKDEYQWSPSIDLDDPNIANPIGVYSSAISTISYLVKATDTFGCYGIATVNVTIARTKPDIFMPNAFTPGTGSNGFFRPICIGIATLEYFQVYSRWGQLLYSTAQMGQGWDGRIGGRLQESNAYLWMVKGTDYTGRVISKKGTMMLIR